MEAVFLAQDKMEEIMAKKAASGYSAVSTANFPTAAENIIRNGATAFTRTTTITEVAESDFTTVSVGSGYKKVVVTVAWSSGGGGSRYLQTIFANY